MSPLNLEALSDLAALMDAQVGMLDDLCELGRKKTALLVDNDLTGLEAVVKAEQTLLWKIGRLEERRFRQQVLLAGDQGPEAARLNDLVRVAPAELRQRLAALQERYGRNVTELGRLNETNRRLIEQALSFVDFTLELIAIARGSGQTYTGKGKRKPVADKGQPVLDSRA